MPRTQGTMELMNDYRHSVMTAALAAFQALILTWMAIVLIAVFVYTVNASSPMLVDARWQDAAVIGTHIWLLSLGSPAAVGTTTISLMPLGLTCLVLILFWRFFGNRQVESWWHILSVALTSGIFTFLMGFIGFSGTLNAQGPLVAAALFTFSAIAQWWRYDPPPWRQLRALHPVKRPLLYVTFSLMAFAVVLAMISVVINWTMIGEINGYFILGLLSTIVFTLFQVLFLPNIVVWTVAYASGVGFAVGDGTSFSSLGVTSAPLPAIPVCGALPGPGSSAPWLIGVLVLIGILVGIRCGDRFSRLRDTALYGVGVLCGIFVIAAIAGFVATGGIGEGRMAFVGVVPAKFAAFVALEVGGGFLLGLLLRNEQTLDYMRNLWHRMRGQARDAEAAVNNDISEEGMDDVVAESVRSEVSADGTDGVVEAEEQADGEREMPAAPAPSPLESYKQRYARRPVAPPAPEPVAPTAATAATATADFIPTAATAFSPPHAPDEDESA